MSLDVIKPTRKAPRIVIYGPPGIGKSTFGAKAEKPIFLQLEDGAGALDVDAFALAEDFAGVMKNIKALAKEDHDYKTLVIDSVDWLEPLIWRKVCDENDETSIEKVGGGYGKGYTMALDVWRHYLNALNWLRDNKGMTIVQIAHSDIKRFEDPRCEAYDRFVLKLNQKAAGLVTEHADIVTFAEYHTSTETESKGFGSVRARAIGGGARMLNFSERPAFASKNRYGLPDKVPFDKDGKYWTTIRNAVEGKAPEAKKTETKLENKTKLEETDNG